MESTYKKIYPKFILILSLMTIFLGIYKIDAKAATSTDPQLGTILKQVRVGEQVQAIDSRDGWWLIAENGKLEWCNAGPTSYWKGINDPGYPKLLRIDRTMNIYEAQPVYTYKKGQTIEVIDGSVTGWWKVKTPDGYSGWLNAGPTSYNSSGTLVANTDLSAYFTADIAPLQQIKEVQVGEQIKAIDSRYGWWMIDQNGKLGWVKAGPTSYWNNNTSTYPILLKANAKMPVNEAGIVYTYARGQKITVIQGSVPGWWKVKAPNGYYAWVNAGPTYYNSNGDLLASSSLSAYYSGKGNSGQAVSTNEQKLINESKYWISKIPYKSPSLYRWQSDVLNRLSPPSTMDCSDFTSAVYATTLKIKFSDYTGDQMKVGTKISIDDAKQGNYSNLKVGDLIIFTWPGGNYSSGDHVAMYIGNGEIIHESGTNSRGGNVKISNLNDYWGSSYGYLRSNIISIRRIL